MFDDLRGFIQELDERGQLMRVEGADWNLEIGTIVELMAERKSYALLFDNIKGYPEGYRIATSLFQTPLMQKVAFGFDKELSDIEVVKAFKDKWNRYKPVPPKEVDSGPVKENILTGDKVDILKFPAPKWHEKDGGRYIGTGCLIITQCPDTGWVNIGTYRVMVHNKNTLSFYISPGNHGRIMRETYWSRGEDCPVVMCFGQDPLLFGLSTMKLPWGMSEYDLAGHIKGKAIEVVRGDVTGLPIPSTAEIAIEGFAPPPSVNGKSEGPFGEWTGYYASGARVEPIVNIEAIYHRDDPIIHGQPPLKPSVSNQFSIPIHTVATLWNALEKAGMQGIKGVWGHGPSNRTILVISIEQKYLGHAKQIATFVASVVQGIASNGRFIIVVDSDIDPSNLDEVLWAVCTRCDPELAIDIVRGYLTSSLDPMLSPERRNTGDTTTAKVLIDACRPYRWIKEFPHVNIASEELKRKVKNRWSYLFS